MVYKLENTDLPITTAKRSFSVPTICVNQAILRVDSVVPNCQITAIMADSQGSEMFRCTSSE